MGRVWLGATHGARLPETAAPVAAGRALVAQPAQPHHRDDAIGAQPPADRRSRWLRWRGRNS